MTAPELKPCPFCGRGAEFSLGKTGDGKDWHYTECVNCGATGPLVNYADHNIAINDALVDAWNRRADLAAVPAQVRVKWDGIETAPRGGEWFIARTEHGTTRVVHFADEYDRLPISHDGVVWSTTPTEWTPLEPVLAAIEPQPDPRDAVIARLVEAADECSKALKDYMKQYPHMVKGYLVDAEQHANDALAAAKAVLK